MVINEQNYDPIEEEDIRTEWATPEVEENGENHDVYEEPVMIGHSDDERVDNEADKEEEELDNKYSESNNRQNQLANYYDDDKDDKNEDELKEDVGKSQTIIHRRFYQTTYIYFFYFQFYFRFRIKLFYYFYF